MSDILNQDEIDALAVTADTPDPVAPADPSAPDAPDAADPPADDRPRDEHGRFAPKDPAADPADPAQPDAEQRQVPQQALHAEREKRKGVEAQLRQAQEQLAGIQALRAKITAPPQAQTPQNPAPDAQQPPADDPNGVEHLKARLAALEGHTEATQRSQQQAQVDDYELRVLSQQATADEETFRTVQPDYDEAINYLVGARARELQAYGLDRITIENTVRDEAADIVRTAISQGKSPAELSYQIAQYRGYRPAQGQQAPQQQQAPTNGAQATLDAIARGRAASKSPGQGGGAAPTQLNAATLAQMGQDEFDALYATEEGRRMIDAL